MKRLTTPALEGYELPSGKAGDKPDRLIYPTFYIEPLGWGTTDAGLVACDDIGICPSRLAISD